MVGESFDGRKKRSEREIPAGPECVVVRQEIMATVLGEGGVVAESVSVHLERCEPCRAWEAGLRKMHALCGESRGEADPSRLTAAALESRATSAQPEGRARARAVHAEPVLDRGALFVILLAVVLFNSILAFFLRGTARALYSVVGFVAMTVPAIWVYADSARRGMPAAFWAALQPFTVPIGLIAYLVCRERSFSRCPGCGRALFGQDRFCPECGRKLTEFCCGCGRPVRKEFRICPFCGTRLEECFPLEDAGGAACGWSRRDIAFVAVVNAALFVGFLAALFRGGPETAFVAAFLYLFGYFPVFNWVSIDSRRRAMPTVLWGILVLVTLYVGLVIYLACRKDERVTCPVCGSHPPASFNFCPCCGSVLGSGCPACGAACAQTDRFCASCGVEVVSGAASPPSPE